MSTRGAARPTQARCGLPAAGGAACRVWLLVVQVHLAWWCRALTSGAAHNNDPPPHHALSRTAHAHPRGRAHTCTHRCGAHLCALPALAPLGPFQRRPLRARQHCGRLGSHVRHVAPPAARQQQDVALAGGPLLDRPGRHLPAAMVAFGLPAAPSLLAALPSSATANGTRIGARTTPPPVCVVHGSSGAVATAGPGARSISGNGGGCKRRAVTPHRRWQAGSTAGSRRQRNKAYGPPRPGPPWSPPDAYAARHRRRGSCQQLHGGG